MGSGVKKSRLFTLLVHLPLVLGAIVSMLPMFWLVCATLKTGDDLFRYDFLPWDHLRRLTLDNFRQLIARGLLAVDLDTPTLVSYVDRFLMYYVRSADRLQRTAAWIESLDGGLGHVKDVVIADSLGLCSELEADMLRHVESYTDEWAATLDDPEKLARFVSFVNAPRTADPDIVFVAEREQHRPARASERADVVIAARDLARPGLVESR